MKISPEFDLEPRKKYSQKFAQTDICQSVDVHRKDREYDRTARCFFELCTDLSQPVASLGKAEGPFYFYTVRVVGVFDLPVDCCVFPMTSEPGPR